MSLRQIIVTRPIGVSQNFASWAVRNKMGRSKLDQMVGRLSKLGFAGFPGDIQPWKAGVV
jgi:putative component of toxin-antitoxin plasmid stabilization module